MPTLTDRDINLPRYSPSPIPLLNIPSLLWGGFKTNELGEPIAPKSKVFDTIMGGRAQNTINEYNTRKQERDLNQAYAASQAEAESKRVMEEELIKRLIASGFPATKDNLGLFLSTATPDAVSNYGLQQTLGAAETKNALAESQRSGTFNTESWDTRRANAMAGLNLQGQKTKEESDILNLRNPLLSQLVQAEIAAPRIKNDLASSEARLNRAQVFGSIANPIISGANVLSNHFRQGEENAMRAKLIPSQIAVNEAQATRYNQPDWVNIPIGGKAVNPVTGEEILGQKYPELVPTNTGGSSTPVPPKPYSRTSPSQGTTLMPVPGKQGVFVDPNTGNYTVISPNGTVMTLPPSALIQEQRP